MKMRLFGRRRVSDLMLQVWARVQWYWSGKDVAGLIKSLYISLHFFYVTLYAHSRFSKPSNCGRYERIYSDQYDYVSSQSFNGMSLII